MTQNNEREMIEEVAEIKSADWNRFAQTNNERVALIADAEESGFYNHPIHGLVTRHSNGSWVSVAEKLEKFAELQLARAISKNEHSKREIPDGWKLVRIEPTDEMLEKIWELSRTNDFTEDAYEGVIKQKASIDYKAMINASPSEINTEVGND